MPGGMRWTCRQPALAMMSVTALAIFLPVTLMGGALPVASAAVVRRLKDLGRSIGDLVAINTLGAIAGAFDKGSNTFNLTRSDEDESLLGVGPARPLDVYCGCQTRRLGVSYP